MSAARQFRLPMNAIRASTTIMTCALHAPTARHSWYRPHRVVQFEYLSRFQTRLETRPPLRPESKMSVALVTAANSRFFESVQTLIASVHRLDDSRGIREIVVYDLGLAHAERERLNSLDLVAVTTYPSEHVSFPDMMEPGQYAWKWPMLLWTAESTRQPHVLWMDAGAVFWSNPKPIFDRLARDQVFLVEDTHLNRTWTSLECRAILRASEAELDGKQIWAGMAGYKVHGRYFDLLKRCDQYSRIRECVCGTKTYSDDDFRRTGIRGHRHDQSIASILSQRVSAPRSPIALFGEWRPDHLTTSTVVYTHRGQYRNHNHK